MYEKIGILKPFFEESNREFHIRELARVLQINQMTAKKYLEQLKKEGFLLETESKYVKNYKADIENEKFREYKRFFNMQNLIDSGLISLLDREFAYPAIVAFGSFEKGEDSINSDIDIFILSETKKELNLEQFEKKLKRKVQLHVFSEKEYEKLKKNNPHLVNNIANGRVLRGHFYVLK
ncbi:nucleotidyltransferase domain-containing protein [Candidatus Woesearchaeota archaeon]|nr:nucleotidyltransferase domain-containing protein [Candidatus Woesearchaeota archaeon]